MQPPPEPGEHFGRWTVVAAPERLETGRLACACRCDCGTERVVLVQTLRRADRTTPSCGCWRRERSARTVAETRWAESHGLAAGGKHPLYRLWQRIKRRCYDEAAHNYRWYGGRGIGMAAEWRDDPAAFVAYVERELAPRPDGTSIDRIDNDGDYAPGNLRWATAREQAANRRVAS